MIACQELSKEVGTVAACNALDIARPTYYRRLGTREENATSRPAPPRTLSANERQEVLEVLHSERFVDQAPAEVYATLLDEGVYHCSFRNAIGNCTLCARLLREPIVPSKKTTRFCANLPCALCRGLPLFRKWASLPC